MVNREEIHVMHIIALSNTDEGISGYLEFGM